MAIAAVPDYLGKDFSTASPGMRFGMYFQGWNLDWSKRVPDQKKNDPPVLASVCALHANDIATMHHLLKRQQAGFKAIAATAGSWQVDALSTAPFSTGLGNEHPLDNGFAFLNPYGLPYLPGSGVKGVLRQAARELVSGEWGDASGWDEAAITALFGLQSEDGDTQHQRGALSFWDVIPQLKGDSLSVEIMTPHQKHYYQDGQNPHDSGSPNPISFLSVPPGSGFTFHVQCNLALLKHFAPQLLQDNRWQALLQDVFTHAFDWLGFGAKTAVGYGAMQEDQAKKAEREQQQAQQKEQARLAALSPEDLAFEENRPLIEKFRAAFEQARSGPYQPGQEFDGKRNEFIQAAMTWDESRSRAEAAELLAATLKWGVSKKGKDRLKEVLAQLRGNKE